ncbi:MAG: hypothetical protein IKF19_04395 [Bacilli bacterium]|nr:hypothetical protein [Bacilli bacterium]
MKELVLNKDVIIKNDYKDVYTYNVLMKKFLDDSVFLHFVSNELYRSDLKDVDLDKYRDYIFEIIDDADYVFIETLKKEVVEEYKKKLNYKYYDKVILWNSDYVFNVNYLFEIGDDRSKQIVKNDLKFNLSDDYREPVIVKTNKKYILNEEYYENCSNYVFVKDNKLLISLHQYDGYIYDHRDSKVRDRQIKKYLNK